MKTKTEQEILAYISQKKEVSAKDIINNAGFTPQAVFRHLRKLIQKGKIIKIGHPPKVYYSKRLEVPAEVLTTLPVSQSEKINDNFFTVTPLGEIRSGLEAFESWCAEQSLPVEKTASEYVSTLEKYDVFKTDGLIDGLNKLQKTFSDVFLDALYYLDFYSIERFGKTKLGSLILYAKQTQNRKLIDMIYQITRERIERLIKQKNIDAVGFIPPTIPRQMQFQKEFADRLALSLPQIKIIKATGEVAVPQKSLSKLDDRVVNARSTIFIDENIKRKNILLIDDAVGSGATLNETARKIREKQIVTGKIIGLALVGSFKGFDVISEV